MASSINNIAVANVGNHDKIFLDVRFDDADKTKAAFIVSSLTGDIWKYCEFLVNDPLEYSQAHEKARIFYNSFVDKKDLIPFS